jgi:hypothetical protein
LIREVTVSILSVFDSSHFGLDKEDWMSTSGSSGLHSLSTPTSPYLLHLLPSIKLDHYFYQLRPLLALISPSHHFECTKARHANKEREKQIKESGRSIFLGYSAECKPKCT